jgi:site-specific recombinase XerD
MKKQINNIMNIYMRSGAKKSRRDDIKKLHTFAEWLFSTKHGVTRVENISRRHIYEFYEYLFSQNLTNTTIEKYSRVIKIFWVHSERKGKPPQPHST